MSKEKFSEFAPYSTAKAQKAGIYIVGVDESLPENIKIPAIDVLGGAQFNVTAVAFVNQTSVTVNHNLGRPPILIIREETTGQEIICAISHTDDMNTFTVEFNPLTTGTIYYY